MKLKMVRGPRPGQKDMVAQTKKKTYAVSIDGILDVPEEDGHEIMTLWPQCFKIEQEQKVMKTYKNKSVSVETEAASDVVF